jgi:hypothetical protein
MTITKHNHEVERLKEKNCANNHATCVRNPLYEMQIQFQSNCELKSYCYSVYWFICFAILILF